MKCKNSVKILLFALLAISIVTGCSKTREGASATSSCGADSCHVSTIVNKYYPTDNPLHQKHVEKFTNQYSEPCSVCHYDYNNVSYHKNGTIDNSTTRKLIVYFDKNINPNGSWDVASTTCQNMTCHGNIDWNTTATDTCLLLCHQSGNKFPEPPDPFASGSHTGHGAGTDVSCSECHNNYKDSSTHADGTLNTPSDTSSMISFDSSHNPNGTYNPSSKECSDTVCHGNFTGGNASTPAWGGTVDCATARCHGSNSSGNPAGSTNADSKHGTHVTMLTNTNNPSTGSNYTEAESCGVCHTAYGDSTHNNGQIDISFDYSQGGSSGTVTGGALDASTGAFNTVTCSDTYCHGNFTGGNSAAVSWSDNVACGSCHPADSTLPVSVKHTKHLDTYPDQCGYCHQGYTRNSAPANHINFVKDVVFGYGHPANTAGSPSYDSASKTCTNVYCHGNFPVVSYTDSLGVTASINPGNRSNPLWLDSATSQCGSCHGSSTNNYSSPTHGKHTAVTSNYFDNSSSIESCDACHNYGSDGAGTGWTASSAQGSYGTLNHADFSIDSSGVNADVNFKADNSDLASKVSPDTQVTAKTTWNGTTQKCSNSWCHGNFTGSIVGDNNTANDPNWLDATTGLCQSCHTATVGTSGAHTTHTSAPYSYSCSKCHAAGFTGHVNGIIGGSVDMSVGFDGTNPNGVYTPGATADDGVCSDLYCHGNTTGGDWSNFTFGSSTGLDNDPTWTSTPNTVPCGTCHNASSATLGTGSHTKHIGNDATNYNYPCIKCHSESIESDNITLKAGHADGILSVVSDTWNPSGVYTSSTRTCSSFYCHGSFTGGNSASPVWGSASTGACGTCHDLAPANSNYGSHDKHTNAVSDSISGYAYDCSNCHNGIASGTEEGGPSLASITLHANNVRNIIFDTAGADKPGSSAATWDGPVSDGGTGARVCANTYCHGDFNGGNGANTADWDDGTGGTCGNCHDLAPANSNYGAHDKHTDSTAGNYNYDCNLCHSGIADGSEGGTVSFNASYKSYHADFTATVRFSGIANQYTSVTAGYSSGICSNTYCHGDFGLGTSQWPEGNTANNPNWILKTGGACGNCHGEGNNATLGIPTTSPWNSGSHAKHAGLYTESGYNYPCGFCHEGVYDATLRTGSGTGETYEIGTKTPTALHANGARDFAFYTAFTGSFSSSDAGAGYEERSCSLMYCHSDGYDTTRTVADTGGISEPVWGGGAKSTITCVSCHNHIDPLDSVRKPAPRHNDPTNANNPKDHYNKDDLDRHTTSCAHCHSKVTTATGESWFDNSITYSNNRHVNRTKNISFGIHTAASGSGSYSYDRDAGGTCYVDCHTSVGIQKDHNPKRKWYDFGNGYSYPTNDNWTYEP